MRRFFSGPKAMRPVDFPPIPGNLHSVAKQASLFFVFQISDVRWISEGFGNPTWKPKSILEMFLATFFSSVISASILDQFFGSSKCET